MAQLKINLWYAILSCFEVGNEKEFNARTSVERSNKREKLNTADTAQPICGTATSIIARCQSILMHGIYHEHTMQKLIFEVA